MSGAGGRHLPALGWDPCPGDVAGARAVADDLRVVARALRRGEEDARADAPAWRGAAAAQHRARVEALPTCLRLVAGSVEAFAAVVEEWAGTLARLQARADDVERRMVLARDAVGEASLAAALVARSVAGEDVVRGRLPGTTAHARARDLLEGAAAGQVAVEAEAQRLHLEHAERGAAAARRAASAVDDGLRAPWTGLVRSPASLDGGWVRPRRDLDVVLERGVGEDLLAEAVHQRAGRIAAASDGAAALAGVTALAPPPPAQVASRVLGAGSELGYAGLSLVVAEDGGRALEHLGLAGASLGAGAVPRLLARRGADAARRADAVGHGYDAALGGLPGPPAPEPWEVPGYEGTARRTPGEERRRQDVARRAAVDRLRTSEVRRCVET
ncbi:hypothetical protein [uncultured Pseudokineococcus sp.]|uniref:hypothetical protein n=1 Tax=uncultured Pseudokineococcus sp. TaxID=1642928 RepID=UPI002617A4C6|nr:hypothetical protein [uncultured Pseudokineococcus sp.]